MSESHIQVELRNSENKLRHKYSMFFRLFFLIVLIFIVIIIIIISGVAFLGYGYNWTGLSLDNWLILSCFVFGLIIIIELIFYSQFSSLVDKRIELEKPKPEFIDGKKVYIYTLSKGKEGGVFSKTYIEIDDNSILRLRNLIIPPEEL